MYCLFGRWILYSENVSRCCCVLTYASLPNHKGDEQLLITCSSGSMKLHRDQSERESGAVAVVAGEGVQVCRSRGIVAASPPVILAVVTLGP